MSPSTQYWDPTGHSFFCSLIGPRTGDERCRAKVRGTRASHNIAAAVVAVACGSLAGCRLEDGLTLPKTKLLEGASSAQFAGPLARSTSS